MVETTTLAAFAAGGTSPVGVFTFWDRIWERVVVVASCVVAVVRVCRREDWIIDVRIILYRYSLLRLGVCL